MPAWAPGSPIRESLPGDSVRQSLELFDFALLWDEDHNERIWPIVERIWTAGLLAPIRYMGERKASVVVILDEKMDFGDGGIDAHTQPLERCIEADEGDSWHVMTEVGLRPDTAMINSKPELVLDYLKSIAAPWRLGSRPFVHKAAEPAL